ncbi:MAG: hypothetical protein ACOCVF_01885 [bacterium]
MDNIKGWMCPNIDEQLGYIYSITDEYVICEFVSGDCLFINHENLEEKIKNTDLMFNNYLKINNIIKYDHVIHTLYFLDNTDQWLKFKL